VDADRAGVYNITNDPRTDQTQNGDRVVLGDSYDSYVTDGPIMAA